MMEHLFGKAFLTAARWYMVCLVGLVLLQSFPRLFHKFCGRFLLRRGSTDGMHKAPTVWLHKLTYFNLPFYPYYPMRIIVFLVLYVALTVLFAWQNVSLESDAGYMWYGYMALVNMSVAVLFALRNSPANWLSLPFERTIDLHRIFGLAAVAFGWVHGGLFLSGWIRDDAVEFQFEKRPRLRYGPAIASILAFMFLTSVPPIRRRMWELFLAIHLVGFLAAYILINFHSPSALQFTLPPLILWAIDGFIRNVGPYVRPAKMVSTSAPTPEMTKLTVHHRSLFRRHAAGQYVMINVPKAGGAMEWHPASIASVMPTNYDEETAGSPGGQPQYTLALRTVGKFTRKLNMACAAGEELTIMVDGPYGTLDIPPEPYALVVLIAGGIGITPLLSIATALIADPTRSVHLIWAVRQELHMKWVADELKALARMGVKIKVFVTRSDASVPVRHREKEDELPSKDSPEMMMTAMSIDGYEVFYARPSVVGICAGIKAQYPDDDAFVGVCGPASLVRNVRRAVRFSSDARSLWHMHAEAFEF
ncbi:hypothetical protein HDU85_007707 [Gaertneriomyces sp. JEL0708]|nr:hypothetical protein HDU85_007707 [Gaertneriomyces sp. JEL0708]